jgi:methylmalonyl-CoA epimerase
MKHTPSPPGWAIAQVNIARMLGPSGSPVMADFFASLDRINALAEHAPGFLWRLKGEENNATALRVFEDDLLIINMSVWESIEALHAYTYQAGHAEVFRRRKDWFGPLERPGVALWWHHLGDPWPTPDEAKARLAHLEAHGPTAHAFLFRAQFAPPTDEHGPAPADAHGPAFRVHHLAVVVPDLTGALGFWRDALGLHASPIEHNAAEAVDLAFLHVGESEIELIAPTDESSGVARYLAKTGGGLHHVCLEVSDLDAAADRLRAHGAELITETPRTRPDGRRYLFVHPRSTGGVLLELYGPHPAG